jgi:hypothetical protein
MEQNDHTAFVAHMTAKAPKTSKVKATPVIAPTQAHTCTCGFSSRDLGRAWTHVAKFANTPKAAKHAAV